MQNYIHRLFSSDITSLAHLVCKANPTIKSSESLVEGLKRLKNIEEKTDIWINSVCLSPSIMDFNGEEIKSVISTFYAFSISHETAWQVIGNHPDLIEIPRSSLQVKLSQVEGFSRSAEVSLETLLAISPCILYLEPEEIGTRIGCLQEYFTKSQAYELFLNSPSVMFDSWPTIESRIQYLFDVMHVHVDDILKASDSFTIESEVLSLRYEFLDRAGLYKHPEPKGIEEGLHAFPHLKDIIEGSNEEFLRKVVKDMLTMEELQAFEKMLKKEKDEYSKHFDFVGFEDMDYVEDQIEQKMFIENTKKKPRRRK